MSDVLKYGTYLLTESSNMGQHSLKAYVSICYKMYTRPAAGQLQNFARAKEHESNISNSNRAKPTVRGALQCTSAS